MTNLVDLVDGRNNEVSKGVFIFNSCSTPSYHLVNDVSLLIYPISGSNQDEVYFVFVGCKAVRELPALIKGVQPNFMLVPVAYEDKKPATQLFQSQSIHGFE